ncbi:hypothetical protein FM112_12365 [Gulosibacter sp. 10]|nr:hypothetical protein FM112_12365 [Gulosibacter sp. 10]
MSFAVVVVEPPGIGAAPSATAGMPALAIARPVVLGGAPGRGPGLRLQTYASAGRPTAETANSERL